MITAQVCRSWSRPVFSSRLCQENRMAWGWDWFSAVRLSRHMADGYGPKSAATEYLTSYCRLRSRETLIMSELAVFIVDDDAGVRDSLGLLLGIQGYRIALFANSEDFIAAWRADWLGCLVVD